MIYVADPGFLDHKSLSEQEWPCGTHNHHSQNSKKEEDRWTREELPRSSMWALQHCLFESISGNSKWEGTTTVNMPLSSELAKGFATLRLPLKLPGRWLGTWKPEKPRDPDLHGFPSSPQKPRREQGDEPGLGCSLLHSPPTSWQSSNFPSYFLLNVVSFWFIQLNKRVWGLFLKIQFTGS